MRILPLALISLSLCAAFTPGLLAQEDDAVHFAKPKLLMAGEVPLGGKMMYPSPSVLDINGDGILDIALGDLFGAVNYALGKKTDQGMALEAETSLTMQGGKPIDFNNW